MVDRVYSRGIAGRETNLQGQGVSSPVGALEHGVDENFQ